MITIIDYKVGNIGSIYNMLKKLNIDAKITSDLNEIEKADKIILPGVGSYDTGMQNLKEMKFTDLLNFKVLEQKTPVLGICLGMQLLTNNSEEGNLSGLGWVNGSSRKFSFDLNSRLKVPHMGWNYVSVKKESSLFKNMYEEPRFYFVHSYYVEVADKSDELCATGYGIDFTSAIEHNNVFGVQFHPEKSHKFGMKLLANFNEI